MNVIFDDGSLEECDLLIGADGIGSKVRNQLLPNSKVSDSDVAVIYFKIPLTPDTKELLPAPSAAMVCAKNLPLKNAVEESANTFVGFHSE